MPSSKAKAKEQWINGYLDYLKEDDQAPLWVYQFTDAIGKNDQDFYQQYQDIDDLEQEIWIGFFKQTEDALLNDEHYAQFTAREKLLSFYFTLLEVLDRYRHASILMLDKGLLPAFSGGCLRRFRQSYLNFIEQLVGEAIQEQSILDRVPFTEYYKHVLWLQCHFVIMYWKRDRSQDNTHTDAAIEKAVNLSFDLLGQNALDSLAGMGKFLYQTWWSK